MINDRSINVILKSYGMVIHVYPPNAMYRDHMLSRKSLLTKTSN